MSPFSTLLVVLVVCVSCVAAAGSVTLYSDTGCSNQIYRANGLTFSNTAASSCFAISGTSGTPTILGGTLQCVSIPGLGTGEIVNFYSNSTCTTAFSASSITAASTTGGCYATGSGYGNIQSVKVNCNSAFSTHNLSIAIMVILAILAMISM